MAIVVKIAKSGKDTKRQTNQAAETSPLATQETTSVKIAPSLNTKALNTAMLQIGKQAINKGVSTYFSISGNSTTERQVNDATSLAVDVASIAAGGVAGVAFVVAKHAMEIGTSHINQVRDTFETEKRNVLLGKISTKGSRF